MLSAKHAHSPYRIFLLALCLCAKVVMAQDGNFIPASPATMVEPVYPEAALKDDKEGLVVVAAMIGPDGKARDSAVVAALGPESLEAAALEAMNSSTFTPATVDGEVVATKLLHKFAFKTGGRNTGPSRQFVNRYRFFDGKVREGDQEATQEGYQRLLDLGASNQAEIALLHMAGFLYHQQVGTEFDQISHLSRALALNSLVNTDNTIYLQQDMITAALRELFRLEVKNAQFGEAAATYNMILDNDDELAGSYEAAYNEIMKLKAGGDAYPVPGMLDDEGHWTVKLFRNNVGFVDVDGRIDEVKLWCTRGFGKIAIENDLNYSIPETWGDCILQILGKPGSTFSLVQ